MMSSFLKAVYHKLFPGISVVIERELSGCHTLLDLGCGRHSFVLLPHVLAAIRLSVGVDAFEPYLLESKSNQRHSQYIQADVRRIEFKPRSFDAVVALDLLEHLTKEEGAKLIQNMKMWSRKKVIILTTNGFLGQDAYDENPLQEHKSGWDVQELRELGFGVYGVNGWKELRGHKALIKFRPTFLWTRLSDMTQKVTYYFPDFAFQLLAVQNQNDGTEPGFPILPKTLKADEGLCHVL